ncbi:MAG: acyl-CoA dehydrogenase family protein [Desulfobacterales bacterium]
MDFGFSKDQNLIRKSAREFFEKECPKDIVRELKKDIKGYNPKFWKKMAQLGFLGLALPEVYGGTEGEYIDLMIFMEEMGRNIVPSPYFSTICMCAPAIDTFGSDIQKKSYLPGIAEKGDIWSFAINEEPAGWESDTIEFSATPDGDDYVLNGKKLFVPYANSAKMMLVAARTSNESDPKQGITIFIVDAKSKGVEIEVIPTAARDMKCEVRFDSVLVSKDNIIGELNKGDSVIDHVIQFGSVLKSAEMSGGVAAALGLAVKYAKEREQFGKPIASFQSLQHRMVQMQTEVDGLRNLVYQAAWKMNMGTPDRMLNSMAKVKANKVYHRVCYDAVYIHGAIGWTEEMDVSLYLLRSKTNENACGGTDFHLERIAEEMENFTPDFMNL